MSLASGYLLYTGPNSDVQSGSHSWGQELLVQWIEMSWHKSNRNFDRIESNVLPRIAQFCCFRMYGEAPSVSSLTGNVQEIHEQRSCIFQQISLACYSKMRVCFAVFIYLFNDLLFVHQMHRWKYGCLRSCWKLYEKTFPLSTFHQGNKF